jgi:hypothetical protein
VLLASWCGLYKAPISRLSLVATDPLARKLALNFPGGTLTATRGLLQAVWGPDLGGAATDPAVATISVSGHTRQRVIGGPTKTISANTYTRKKYPVGGSAGAAGGESVALQVGGKWWTARLSGSHQAFNDFLRGSVFFQNAPMFWRSERGTAYGPFSS